MSRKKAPVQQVVEAPRTSQVKAYLEHPKTPLVLGTLVLIVLAGAGYLYTETQKLARGENPELQEVVAAVGKHVVLPEGETPAFATVEDPATVANDPFLSKAKKGNQVLFYAESRKVYLYDPESDRVVDIGTVAAEQ